MWKPPLKCSLYLQYKGELERKNAKRRGNLAD
uniref:Uncharacterized protein n=1 Tax=Ackermannviridae sp. TaxID=2831612 RepID=A0A8S5VPR5_9CAUD|nr:MAG TPA: hypothetical protein [Ackermannviridae sp.]